MKILGISAYYHDSAAAIIVDGKVLFAAQEERFTRIKNDASFPESAIQFCLSESGLAYEDIDIIAFYDKPFQTMYTLSRSLFLSVRLYYSTTLVLLFSTSFSI